MQMSKCLLVLCPLFVSAAALADVPAGYTITVLGGAGTTADALGLNNLGQIVGESEGAFLYSDGVVYDLNTLAAHDGSLTLTSARDINDRDEIIATACDTGGGCYSVLLSPVPEPSPIAMLLAGLGLAGGLRYRQERKKTCLSQKACL